MFPQSDHEVFGTQDVRELLNCLRAIDSPANQVAVVAALRSSAFGCSDVELLEFVDGGGKLDYLDPGQAAGPVNEALSALREFHLNRLWQPPEDLIEEFIRHRQMIESSFGRARPRERWRRLRFVVEQSRAFSRVSTNSLRGFLDWFERQAEEGARTVEVPVPETDEQAVRIMTVHASKGLEFPIVILAGLGSRPNNRSEKVIPDREAGTIEVKVGDSKGTQFSTTGYEQANRREKLAGEAEEIRKMYVAATRAKDHLIVSLFHPNTGLNSLAATILKICPENALWDELPTSPAGGMPRPQTKPVRLGSVADTAEARADWVQRRDEVIRKAATPASLAVTKLAQVQKEEADDGETPYRRGRGGTNVGRAVHSVLQTLDLATGEGLEEISRAQASAEGIPGRGPEIAALARRAIDSQVVKRAVDSGRFYREIFVSLPLDGTLFEGFIDLLFEEDGKTVIVDYKTDALDSEEEIQAAMGRYRLQGGAYALAIQRTTQRSVDEVVFLFLQPQREFRVTDLPGAIEAAEQAAVAQITA